MYVQNARLKWKELVLSCISITTIQDIFLEWLFSGRIIVTDGQTDR